MKKNLFMTAAAIAALLTGCSTDEEIANIETSAKNAIGFNIVSNSAETKATIYGNGSTNFYFDVFAFDGSGNYYMGEADELNFGYLLNEEHSAISKHCGVQIIHDNGKWIYKNPEELAYWPTTNSLDFYAISPTNFNTYPYIGSYTWSIKSDKQIIKYSTFDEFNNKEGHKNIDVMYAVAKNKVKGDNGGVVKLQFKHTLSQVLFRAKVQYEAMEVTINEMKIYNFAHGGTFTIPAGEPSQSDWSEVISTGGSYTVKKAGEDIKASSTTSEEQWISSKEDPMLFIPQKLTAWSTTSSTSIPIGTADTNKRSYIEITMKLTQKGQYLIGSENAYQKIYVPFTNVDTNNATGWEPGKRYIYTLNFGGGYDADGKPVLTPITFDAEVTKWSDASRYNVQVVPEK